MYFFSPTSFLLLFLDLTMTLIVIQMALDILVSYI